MTFKQWIGLTTAVALGMFVADVLTSVASGILIGAMMGML